MDAADGVDREADDVIDVALHHPLEAVAQAEHLEPLEFSADGRGADHGIDAGRRAAAHENGELSVMFHRLISIWRPRQLIWHQGQRLIKIIDIASTNQYI